MTEEAISVIIPEGTSSQLQEDNKDYDIHDNGGVSYITRILNNGNVVLFKCTNILSTLKTFIGKSPQIKMTEYSGGYGDKFDGNTILIQTGTTSINSSSYKYKHIGSEITEFTTEHEIIDFVSPIGNSDVPYPYVIDTQNNYYLIIEKVILENSPELQTWLSQGEDPYSFYYRSCLITPDMGCIPPRQPVIDMNIIEFYNDNERYTLNYSNNVPEGKLEIVYKDTNVKEEISKEQYISIMNEFSLRLGITQMNIL
jgi:hypothetical protein